MAVLRMTRAEYEQKYGQPVSTSQPKTQGTISSAFQAGVEQAKSGYQESKGSMNPLKQIAGATKLASGTINAAISPLAPVLNPIGKAVEAVTKPIVNKVSDVPAVQKFAGSDLGKATARGAEFTGDVANIAGVVTPAPKVVGGTARAVSSGVESVGTGFSKVGSYAKNVTKDVVPSAERVVEHQVSRALDLSPGDLSNISKSTGNEVGKWLADNNLIGVNKETTQKAITGLYNKSYEAVRSEIGKVSKSYKQTSVPRYVEALKQIKGQVDGVAGLQKTSVEVNNLLNKKQLTLNDVQRVKELMDEHFNLYKVTGDVAENVTKQGLATIRKDMKAFIEKEVKENTGADIAKLNNDVSTARSINDAITTRSPKGLTRSNLKIGDLGIFGIGMTFGGPLVGMAALFGKKLLESPTVRLRIAKYLDGVNDARKASMVKEMEAGKIPAEFNQFIKGKSKPQPQDTPSLPQK